MFNNDNNLLLIILVGIILFMIINLNHKSDNKEYYQSSNPYNNIIENMTSKDINSQNNNTKLQSQQQTQKEISNKSNVYSNLKGSMSGNYDNYMLIDPSIPKDPKFDKVMPKDSRKTLSSNELLPVEENDKWFQNPNSKFNLLEAVSLEIPEIKIGIDTVGQSRKNATYDLRTAPPNPKFVVSPWSNSTIEPDYNTKPLC